MAGTREGKQKVWEASFDAWVEACQKVHGTKYGYHLDRHNDNGMCKVRITCPEHGDFLQRAVKHKAGQGCPVCSGNKLHNVREKLEAAFPGQAFPEALPSNSKEKFTLTCAEHGEFEVTLNQLMATKSKYGVACPTCNVKRRGEVSRVGSETLLGRLKEVFPKYEFNLASGQLTNEKCEYDCSVHGVKTAVVSDLLRGHGCNECALEARTQTIRKVIGLTARQNVMDVAAMHGGSVILHYATVKGTHDIVRATCVEHGSWEAMLYAVKVGSGCPRCTHRISKPERELSAWLDSLKVEHVQQCRQTLEQGTLDIYIPDAQVAVEYNGLYWHSEDKAGRTKHLRKLKDAGKAGVRLLTVFEDEWLERPEVVKKVIASALGISRDKVFARNTEVVVISWEAAAALYDANHLQGPGTPCNENLGLVVNGNLVAAMSFREDRFGSHDREVVRYAATTRVVGGFSKLFKNYVRSQAKGTRIVSYCDLRWFTGESYGKAGMVFQGASEPGYWWCKGVKRHSRVGFQKHKLKGKLAVFDEARTESENMRNNGYWKVWDCGMGRWSYTV